MAIVSCAGSAHQASSELFKATVFTPVNSFTSGAEGPAVDKSGNLYAVNFAREGTIGKVTPDGTGSVFIDLPNKSIGNGIRFNIHGDMFIADYTNHNILKVDMQTKQISVFAHEPLMNQPNDIAIDNADRLYASDPNWKEGTGNIWRIDLDGKVTKLEGNMGTANGIEVSPDNKKLLIEFPDFGMDGMRCDSKGNLYITRHGKGTVVKVSPAGKVLLEINLTGKKPSNIAFGGKDGRTAYVTVQDQGNIESFRVDNPGREW